MKFEVRVAPNHAMSVSDVCATMDDSETEAISHDGTNEKALVAVAARTVAAAIEGERAAMREVEAAQAKSKEDIRAAAARTEAAEEAEQLLIDAKCIMEEKNAASRLAFKAAKLAWNIYDRSYEVKRRRVSEAKEATLQARTSNLALQKAVERNEAAIDALEWSRGFLNRALSEAGQAISHTDSK